MGAKVRALEKKVGAVAELVYLGSSHILLMIRCGCHSSRHHLYAPGREKREKE